MENLIRRTKTNLYISLGFGLFLLIAGVLMELLDVHIIENSRAVTGLSLIPFGLALACAVNLSQLKKNPNGMRPAIVAETDERLVAARHHADSITFRLLRWALIALYFGYTFAYPGDIFETAGWWIVTGFLIIAVMLPAVMLSVQMRREKAAADESQTN